MPLKHIELIEWLDRTLLSCAIYLLSGHQPLIQPNHLAQWFELRADLNCEEDKHADAIKVINEFVHDLRLIWLHEEPADRVDQFRLETLRIYIMPNLNACEDDTNEVV